MKRTVQIGCAAAFVLICILTVTYLQTYTRSDTSLLEIVRWQAGEIVDTSGHSEVFDSYSEVEPRTLSPEESFSFSAVLEDVPSDAYLLFETGNLEITVFLDGTELFHSSSQYQESPETAQQIKLPLPQSKTGGQLTLFCRPLTSEAISFPPLVRITSDILISSFNMGYANRTGIPAGAYGLVFVLVCGLFLLGLSEGKADWPLLVLALAAGILTLDSLGSSCGDYFLSEKFSAIFRWSYFPWLGPLALLFYLLLNRKRSFWQYFGRAVLWSIGAFAIAFLISWLRGSYLSSLTLELAKQAASGFWNGVVYWLTIWLVLVSTGITVWGVAQAFAQGRAETETMRIKSQLTKENYETMKRGQRRTAVLLHERKNQIKTLNLLYQQGNLEKLGEYLHELDLQQEELTASQFSENFVLNAILRNESARAQEQNIPFCAQVHDVPKTLRMDDSDLCSLLMNLLDNALEASQNLEPDRRFIRFQADQKDGILNIRCENAVSPSTIIELKKGRPVTTKSDPDLHGLGIKQMHRIVKKYGGSLDFRCEENIVTVQAFLNTNPGAD